MNFWKRMKKAWIWGWVWGCARAEGDFRTVDVYVAGPFTGTDAELVYREEELTRFEAYLTVRGHVTYNPIAASVAMQRFQKLPDDWQYWRKKDEAFLSMSRQLVVLMLEGWDRSVGVRAEIRFARAAGIPIKWVHMSVRADGGRDYAVTKVEKAHRILGTRSRGGDAAWNMSAESSDIERVV